MVASSHVQLHAYITEQLHKTQHMQPGKRR